MALLDKIRHLRLAAVAATAVATACVALSVVAGPGQPASAAEGPTPCQPPGGTESDLQLGFVRDARGRFTTILPRTGGACLHKVVATGINDRGEVVGGYREGGYNLGEGTVRNFLWRQGRLRILNLAGLDRPGLEATASDINDRGDIVGTSIDVATGTYRGFLRDRRGDLTTINHPDASGTVLGASGTSVTKINNRGEIVGYYAAGGTIHGFTRDRRGRFATIDRPGAAATLLTGIDERGRLVGASSDAGPAELLTGTSDGFVLDDGRFTEIRVPGARATGPNEIDNRGRIAGAFIDAAGMAHGFVRDRRGQYTTIDHPAATPPTPGDGTTPDPGRFAGTFIYGLNERGHLVGGYTTATTGAG